MDSSTDIDKAHAQSIDTLLATLLYLMSRYAHSPEARLAAVIAHHLEYVAGHPEGQTGVLLRTATRLKQHWVQQSRGESENQTDQLATSRWH